MDGCSCMFIGVFGMLVGIFIALGLLLYPKRISKQRELRYNLAEEVKEWKRPKEKAYKNEEPLMS